MNGLRRFGFSAMLAVALLLAPGARAGETPAPKFPKQVVLTKTQVENVLATLEPVQALGKKYDKDDNDADVEASDDLGAMIKKTLKKSGAEAEFNGIVTKHGFKGFDDWWPVMFSVMAAAHPEEVDRQSGKAAGAIAEIQSDPKLTPERKAQLIAMMKKNEGIMDGMRPLPQNIPIVAPYAAKVNAALEAE